MNMNWQLQRPASTNKGHQLPRGLNDSVHGHREVRLSHAATITRQPVRCEPHFQGLGSYLWLLAILLDSPGLDSC